MNKLIPSFRIPFVFSALILLNFIFYRCQHEPQDLANFREICFEDEILPIFQNSCAISGCHDDATAKEGYVFSNYTAISASLKPGNSSESPAYTSLVSIGDDLMPPDNPLPLQSRQLIRIWIEQGAQNTTCRDTGNNNGGYVNPRACFERDILPVLISSCGISGCHDAISQKGEYVFIDYSTTIQAVFPGDPNESELYEKITEDNIIDRMPPEGYDPLSSAQVDSIYQWIIYGALNEECGESCDTTSVISYSSNVWPAIESNCKGCHSGSSPSGGILLSNYNDVSALAGIGTLASVLRGTGGKPLMPPSGSLSNCLIRQIEMWIDGGFQNN